MHRLRRLGLGYFDMSAGKKGIRTCLMGRSPYRLLGFLTLTGRLSRIHSYFSCLPFYPPERRVCPRVHAVTLSPTSRPSLFFQLIHLPILGMNTDLLMTPFFAGIGVVDDCGCRVFGTWAVPGFWHEAPDVLVRQWTDVHTSSRGLGGRSVPLSVQSTSFAINFFWKSYL